VWEDELSKNSSPVIKRRITATCSNPPLKAASIAEEDRTVLPSVGPTETQDQDPNRHLQRETMSDYSNNQTQEKAAGQFLRLWVVDYSFIAGD
jgi:hypothetical protein